MSLDLGTKLSAPFKDSDIEWRLQWSDDEKGSGIAVPYVTNRAIQNRLDKTVGVEGWKNEFIPWHNDGKKQSQICGISIFFTDRNEWITKYDGAEDSDIEPVKGGLSDSMKRAAVQWGVGRYLYSMDTVFVDVEKRGKTTVIKKSSQSKLDEAHQNHVKRLFGAATSQDAQDAPRKTASETVPSAEKPAAPSPQPATPKVVEHPSLASAMKNAYCVVNTVSQPSPRGGKNTNLQLKGADGRVIHVFLQGENPVITPGIWLVNAVITKKVKEGIVFYTLDSYELAALNAA